MNNLLFLVALIPLLFVPSTHVNAISLTPSDKQICKNADISDSDCIKVVQERAATEAANKLALSKITPNAQSQNDTAQYIQLKKFASLLGGGANSPLMAMFMPSNDVNGYKQMLSTSVAVNEGYTNDPNPAKYAASNQTLAGLDTKITNYLCSIDQTYCENGPNAPVRIVRNAG